MNRIQGALLTSVGAAALLGTALTAYANNGGTVSGHHTVGCAVN